MSKHKLRFVSEGPKGECQICYEVQPLQMGVCIKCCERVSMQKLPEGWKMYETKNPENYWYIPLQ